MQVRRRAKTIVYTRRFLIKYRFCDFFARNKLLRFISCVASVVALNANDTVRFSDEGLSGVCIAASASGPPDAKVHVPLAPVWTVSDKDVKRRRAVLLILHICAGK